MIPILITGLLVAQTLAPQPAYLLDHPIDENLLILATRDGRFPIALLSGSDCSWVHSDMNVSVSVLQPQLDRLGDGAQACYVTVGEQVDRTPCLANAAGECDIDAGEHFWPTD